MTAATSCPRSASAIPITYAVRPVVFAMAVSTSAGATLAPAVLIIDRAADEVHETVAVDPHQIAGVEPAVGVEALLAAALVVALHHERPADTQLAVVVDLGLESGCGLAERSAPMFGLVGLVVADRDDTAGFGHAEHRVPQLRIGGPHIGGHDRIQIAAAHGRQIAVVEGCGAGTRWPMPATKPFVMVGFSASSRSSVSPASMALEHIRVAPASRVARTANAIPPIQKNGELQNSLSSAVRPRIVVENRLVFEQRRVGVHNPLGRAGRTRRVHDGQRSRMGRRRPPSPRAARRRPCRAGSASMRTWRSSGTADRSTAASRSR